MEHTALRVMTFNILVDKREDAPWDWTSRRDQVLKLIRYYEPDVLCLQEVLEHQKSWLMGGLPAYEATGYGRDDGREAGEQVPVLYRKSVWNLKDHGVFWLSETPACPGSRGWDARCPRTAVWQLLEHKVSGAFLTVINTHYDHRGQTANQHSMSVILRQIPPACLEGNILFCGDLNTPTGDPAWQEVVRNGFVSAEGQGLSSGAPFSYHRFKAHEYPYGLEAIQKEHPRVFRVIDHIFLRGSLRALRYSILPDNAQGVWPSDHFPVLCDFAITGPAAQQR